MYQDKVSSEQALKVFEDSPFVPVFYYDDENTCLEVMKACVAGGLKIIEFTARGANAKKNFKKMLTYREANCPDVLVGIGSLFNAEQTKEFMTIGADFIVSPILDFGMGEVCLEKNMLWIPGVGTATELYRASEAGAKLIKLFPGNVSGPGFASAVLGPMPHLKLMPTGGVKPERENLTAWFKSGVVTVGMGSQLLDKSLINAKDYKGLESKIKATIEVVKEIKSSL